MNQWPNAQLGDVAGVAAGDPAPQGAASFSLDGKPFVRMQDVGRYGRTDNLTETTDKVTDAVSSRLRLFRKGSILVPKSGASIRLNHRAILGMDAHVVSHLAVVTPRPSINGRFLYYWLSCVDMATVAPESDYPSLRLPDLARLTVPLPPLPDQERIVRILDEAEALRRLRAQAGERTRQLATGLFIEMFGEPLTNAREWPMFPLGELSRRITSGSRGWSQFAGRGSGRFLRTQDVDDGEIADDLLPVDPPQGAEAERTRLAPGDVVITITGVVGKSAVFRGAAHPVHVSQHVSLVRPDPNRLVAEYLVAYANLPLRGGPMLARLQYGQTKPGLGFRELRTALIPLPPQDLQRTFAARVGEIRELQAAQAASRKRLDGLFQSLLHRAFRGEL